MIKCDNGLVQISGKGIDIIAEYATLTHEIKDILVNDGVKEKEANEQLREVFERGLLSEEELDKKIAKVVQEIKEPGLGTMLAAAELLMFGLKDKED